MRGGVVVFLFVVAFATVRGFFVSVRPVVGSSGTRLLSTRIGRLGDIGDRRVISTEDGDVVVTTVKGKVYALGAACPHQGYAMTKGTIEIGDDGAPMLHCSLHNSKFRMDNGECVEWCKGVLGIPGTGIIGAAMGMASPKRNARAYKVTVVKADPAIPAPYFNDVIYIDGDDSDFQEM